LITSTTAQSCATVYPAPSRARITSRRFGVNLTWSLCPVTECQCSNTARSSPVGRSSTGDGFGRAASSRSAAASSQSAAARRRRAAVATVIFPVPILTTISASPRERPDWTDGATFRTLRRLVFDRAGVGVGSGFAEAMPRPCPSRPRALGGLSSSVDPARARPTRRRVVKVGGPPQRFSRTRPSPL